MFWFVIELLLKYIFSFGYQINSIVVLVHDKTSTFSFSFG